MFFKTEAEFEVLFRQHYSWLVRISSRVINDNNAAEDLVQEAFINLWEKRDSLQITGDIKGYLRTTVVNRSLNYLRGRIKFTGDDTEVALHAADNTTDSIILTAETEKKVEKVIQALPVNTRLVFTLSRFEEMSYRQIAEQLNVSVKMVEKHMSAALKHLRRYLPVLLIAKFFSGLW